MCGIAGRFAPRALPDAPGWSAQASARLAHRGPDDFGCYRDVRCELVHRRLSIIDLSPTGHQPMANEDGTVWVVFNGEIYNHRPLRSQLAAHGHVFRGTSDTEVLVHLYEEDGDAMVERLRGIFAFAIYDVRRRRLLLARDRYGVKPLFYAQHGEEWIFASEMKAITARAGFRPALDRQACYDYLGLGYIPEPATGFANVRALPGGSRFVVWPGGSSESSWYRVEARSELRDLDAAVNGAEERLLAAVERQSVADVPVAALLSGGIDSSLIVSAHRRATGRGTTTFNVAFPDPGHDETGAARAVAAHCGTEHHTIDGSDRSLTPEALLTLLRHFDQPFADTSFIPMYWVSESIRDHGIKCALSGDGGDESFGGYARFWRLRHLHRLMRIGSVALRVASRAGEWLTASTRDWGRQMTKAIRLAQAARDDSAPLLSGLSNYLTEDEKETLVRREARAELAPAWRLFDGYSPAGARDLDELSRRMTEKLFAVSLPSDMLRKVDMMSMRAGVEVRVPLLDEQVVALGLTLPHALKADGGTGKLVLRALAERWLPREIATLRKRGFSIPLDVMVPPALHGAMEDLLRGADARTRPLLSGPVVRHWLAAFAAAREGRRDGAISREGTYRRALTLLSLELWMRDHQLTW